MTYDPHADYLKQSQQHYGGTAGSYPTHAPMGAPGGAVSAFEHQNIALLPGEESLFAADFTASPILKHIKSGLVVTRDRVTVRHPQYIFFFIKSGHAESSIPIGKISSVTNGRLLSSSRVKAALFAGMLGVFVMMFGASLSAMAGFIGILGILLALVLFAFAGLQAWLARGLALTVSDVGGGHVRVDVDKIEYQNMLTASTLIQRLVVGAGSAGNGEAESISATAAATVQAPIVAPAPVSAPVVPPAPSPSPHLAPPSLPVMPESTGRHGQHSAPPSAPGNTPPPSIFRQ